MSAAEMGHDPKSSAVSTSTFGISRWKLVGDHHRVGGGFSVQFTLKSHEGYDYINCEWSPHLPNQRDLRMVDLARYEAARDDFVISIFQAVEAKK